MSAAPATAIDLSGRRALVTGGGTGIGRQLARTLALAGADVVICGRRAGPLTKTAAEITALGGSASAIEGDVTSERDRARLVAAGPVDILVNNAGYGRIGPWAEVTMDDWHEVLAVNLDAPFRLSQLFVPPMIERAWGRVVNIASVYGMVTGNPYMYPQMEWDNCAYVTSKHALLGLSKYLAVRTGGTGVTVNAISPGMFPFTGANRGGSTGESLRRLRQFTPEGRTGQVRELASALLFLVSPDSAFVTGQNIAVDGGWTLW
jgi:NAD(P)-dependent dehydrogenase (short-subunit alcohol dehydrogenase family)